MTVNGSLKNIDIFHTDRGNEFKNQLIEETLMNSLKKVVQFTVDNPRWFLSVNANSAGIIAEIGDIPACVPLSRPILS